MACTGGRDTQHSILLTPGKAGTVLFFVMAIFSQPKLPIISSQKKSWSDLKSVTPAARRPRVRSKSTYVGNRH